MKTKMIRTCNLRSRTAIKSSFSSSASRSSAMVPSGAFALALSDFASTSSEMRISC